MVPDLYPVVHQTEQEQASTTNYSPSQTGLSFPNHSYAKKRNKHVYDPLQARRVVISQIYGQYFDAPATFVLEAHVRICQHYWGNLFHTAAVSVPLGFSQIEKHHIA